VGSGGTVSAMGVALRSCSARSARSLVTLVTLVTLVGAGAQLGCGDAGSTLGGGSVEVHLLDRRGALADPGARAVTPDEVVHLRIAEYASDHHRLRLSGEDLGDLAIESVDDRRCRPGSASVGSICVGLGGGRRVGDAHVTLTPRRDGDATLEVITDDDVVVASAPLHVRHVATLGGSIRFAAKEGAPPTSTAARRDGALQVTVTAREPIAITVEPRSFDELPFFFHAAPSEVPLPAGLAGGWEGNVLRVAPAGAPTADRTLWVGDARLIVLVPPPSEEGGFGPGADGGGAALAR